MGKEKTKKINLEKLLFPLVDGEEIPAKNARIKVRKFLSNFESKSIFCRNPSFTKDEITEIISNYFNIDSSEALQLLPQVLERTYYIKRRYRNSPITGGGFSYPVKKFKKILKKENEIKYKLYKSIEQYLC